MQKVDWLPAVRAIRESIPSTQDQAAAQHVLPALTAVAAPRFVHLVPPVSLQRLLNQVLARAVSLASIRQQSDPCRAQHAR